MLITARHTQTLLLGICLLWCSSILGFPLLLQSGHPTWASGIYLFFAKVCHQSAARSFCLDGIPLPACARCTAIYLGFLAAVLVSPFFQGKLGEKGRSFWFLLPGMVLVAMEVGLETVGLWQSTLFSRTLTGGLLGFGGGWIVTSINSHVGCPQLKGWVNHD
jgi:uncharacterized membrane protein